MKKLVVGLFVMFVGAVGATTVDLNWLVDDAYYTQTTCESGGDLILPTAPTKYGYTFRGWTLVDEIITGTVVQNGMPTPNNPVTPVFYENNGLILRALGNGENLRADAYSAMTGTITRRVGVKVLDGTENWSQVLNTETVKGFAIYIAGGVTGYIYTDVCLSNKFDGRNARASYIQNNNIVYRRAADSVYVFNSDLFANVNSWTNWLATQYANGTPVTLYYPLAEPVEEVWSGQ